MPHLTLEYTENLLPGFAPGGALMGLNRVLVASGQFQEADIKSRAVVLDTFLVGTAPAGRAFVHARLALLSGRSPAAKRELSDALLAALSRACPERTDLEIQLSVEIADLDRASYAKESRSPS